MNTLVKDTHKAVEFLVNKGMPKDHAEGVVELINENDDLLTKSDARSELVTKADLYRALLLHGFVVIAGISAINQAF